MALGGGDLTMTVAPGVDVGPEQIEIPIR